MALLSLYRRLFPHVERLPSRLRSIHARIWLQLLSPDELIRLTSLSYAGDSGFGDREHNLQGLWPWEQAIVDQYCGRCRTILVAAAGAGREMIALARAGFAVSGFDTAPDLVVSGRRHLDRLGLAAPLVEAAPCDVPADLGVFDALIIGRGAFHHIPGRARRIEFLARCRGHMHDGAPLLVFDFLTRRSKRVGRLGRAERGDHVSSSFFHMFTEGELSGELSSAGFNLVDYRPTDFPGGGNLAQAVARAI